MHPGLAKAFRGGFHQVRVYVDAGDVRVAYSLREQRRPVA
jgi:hypothetical protein